jgi:cytoskeletal protein CcmA (bactofilin family)
VASGSQAGNPGGNGNLAPGDVNLFTYGILTNNFNFENNAVMSSVSCVGNLTMSGGASIGTNSSQYNTYSNGTVTVSNGSGLHGNLTAQGNVSLTGGSNVMNSVSTLGTLYIGGGSTVSGTIEAHESAELAGTFPQAQSDSTITLDGGSVIDGPVNAGGALQLDNGATITGNPKTMGNLTFVGGGCAINGTAYVNGTTTPSYPSTQYSITGGSPQKLASLPSLNLNIPAIPTIGKPNLAWYSSQAQNSGYYSSSGQTIKLDTQSWNGIYYYNGNLTVSSSTPWNQTTPNFSGDAVIVASGTITFDSNQVILPKTSQDSLVLISGGDMDMESNNNSANNTIFLYSGGNMNLLDNPLGQGALACAGTLSIGNGSGNQFTQIMVNPVVVNPAIMLTASGTNLPTGTVGTSYASQAITTYVTASGGTGVYSYSVSGLPAGLSFNATTGVISGTPTVAGTSALTVTVTDSASDTTTCSLGLTVNPAALGITFGGPLPTGIVSVPYNQAITASGGTQPYTWSAAGLPAGLSINSATGVITGTPATAFSGSVTITVKDSGSPQQAASAQFNLTVYSSYPT